MPFQIIRNDITKVEADAIVNTANPDPVIGSGTDRAVYKAAGEELLSAERKKIGRIAPGDAAYTDAFGLNAKYIIHTVGPSWKDGEHGEEKILGSCYEKSLALADKLGCKSIAFPLIATGVYGFPKDTALDIAMSAIGKFLLTHDMKVIMAVFDRNSFVLSSSLVNGIEQYIDDHGVDAAFSGEYTSDRGRRVTAEEERRRTERFREKETLLPNRTGGDLSPSSAFPDMTGKTLEDVVGAKGESFTERLLELIDKSGLDDVTVYKRANVDRKVFSSIRCKKNYKPKKTTAVSFAIALHLDLPELTDLLATAGIAFSASDTFDLIVSYFVTRKNYDIFDINEALFKYGQPLLYTE